MNYFIHGKDEALIKDELNSICALFDAQTKENAVVYDGTPADFLVSTVLEDVNTISLFGDENKLVILKNPSFLSGTSKQSEQNFQLLKSYLESPSPFSTFIILWEEKLSFKKGQDDDSESKGKVSPDKFIKLLKKECEEHNVKELTEQEFQKRVKDDIKNLNISMDYNCYPLLFELLDNNFALWQQESLKLSLYQKPITKEDLPYFIARPLEDKTYELSNAILERNLKKTMEVWEDLLSDKSNQPRNLIIMLANQFRKQYEAILFSKTMSNYEISKVMHLSSEGSVYHLLKYQREFPLEKIYHLLDQLADLDQKIKTYEIDAKLGAELFFIEAVKEWNH